MKKWYFSKNSKITGPLDINEAKAFLTKDPDVYGWHPTFSQWQPASNILEFADVVPAPVAPAQIPPELVEEFLNKKQVLHDKVDTIDESIEAVTTTMYELDQEIKIYKRITQNLSDEVKENINSIEQHNKLMQKSLNDLKQVTDIANNEIDDIVKEFETKLVDKDPSSNQPAHKRVVKAAPAKSTEATTDNKISLVTPKADNKEPAATPVSKPKVEGKATTAPKTEDNIYSIDAEAKKESNVKPVFTPVDKAVGSGSDLDDALAELVATSADGDDVELTEAQEEEQKASRMRRRRRRR